MKYDVFLSYSPADKAFADAIRTDFAAEGITCTDVSALTANLSLKDLIDACKALVLIVSNGAAEDDSGIIMQVETAVKQKKEIISYTVAKQMIGESFSFLTENSINVDAENDESLARLITMVKSVKEKGRKEWKKKLLITGVVAGIVVLIGLSALILVSILNPKPTDSGDTGGCSWRYYDGSKTLSIYGKAECADYSEGEAPWQKYADAIERVVVEEGVTRLGTCSFYQMNALTKVSLPDSLESITTQTFCQCPLLVELTIPEYVFSISGGMISQCPITTLTIPAYVNFIASAPCSECNDLEAFIVDKDNAYFRADDGVLTDAEKTRIIQFPSGKSGSYTFPESVHTIEKFAFHNSSKLEGVTFSDKIEEIPMGCFSFSGLKKVEIPESVTYIGVNAFLCCEQLESVTLTDGLRGIDTAGFYQCTSLKEITVPDSVTEIGMYALSYADVNDEISTYPLTVKGSKNSAAEKYANDNSLIFQATN